MSPADRRTGRRAMRVGLAQINPTVGDISGNARLILDHVEKAKNAQCDLVLFPELCLTGYPPEDLLLKPAFIKDSLLALKNLAHAVQGITAVVGFVDQESKELFNAAAWISKGRIQSCYHKHCLPNYGVFDEKRYFSPGKKIAIQNLNGFKIGLTICEDIWIQGPHLKEIKRRHADFVINISASPFHVGKLTQRHLKFKDTSRTTGCALLYCNLVGGQDELVFDGASFVLSKKGQVVAQAKSFESELLVVDIEKKKSALVISSSTPLSKPLSKIEEIHQALIVGVRDYVRKNGFKKVALGLSGGIDSALVAALATEALGPSNVVGITMPSRFNLSETISDAALVAKNLGIEFHEIPIQPVFESFLQTLKPIFKDCPANIAEENLQARVRGNILMALSNKFGWLVLTTGNKSETSTGYCTLYGDMAGGFAVIKDLLKTTVYELARHINNKAGKSLIPESTIERAPTAELRENQRDEDTLGAYSKLDPVIVNYVEKNLPAPANDEYAKRIIRLIDGNEYKRRQAPPGIKITPRSFGRDHRMPITNRYKP